MQDENVQLRDKNGRLVKENQELRAENLEIKAQLDNSICRDDVPGFWKGVQDLYDNDKIENKDGLLLKHLSERMSNSRARLSPAMQDLQGLLVNRLCRQDYTLVANVLHLSCFEHAASLLD